MFYSLAGLLLIKGLSLDTKVLLKKSRKFLIIGCTIILLTAIMMLVFAQLSERVVRDSEEYIGYIELWQGNYWYQSMIHASFSIGMLILSPLFILWQALGLMYLGSYLYRVGFFTQGPLELLWRTLYKRSIDKKLQAKLKVQVQVPDASHK